MRYPVSCCARAVVVLICRRTAPAKTRGTLEDRKLLRIAISEASAAPLCLGPRPARNEAGQARLVDIFGICDRRTTPSSDGAASSERVRARTAARGWFDVYCIARAGVSPTACGVVVRSHIGDPFDFGAGLGQSVDTFESCGECSTAAGDGIRAQ